MVTGILLSKGSKIGKVEIYDFYQRRARRILPALFTVMVCSIIASWFVMLPELLVDTSYSILASIFFFSNLFFYSAESSYAALDSQINPFLHTWSLSIEEQFYVVFPVLLFAISLFNLKRKWIVIIFFLLVLMSFTYSLYLGNSNKILNFYSPLTRCWELLAGALVAICHQKIPNSLAVKSLKNTFLTGLGVFLIICSIVLIGDEFTHPGLVSLVPVVGTALFILHSKSPNSISKIFSSRPMVYIGLLSYSIYLWHFPIFALARLTENMDTALNNYLLIALVFILSVISFRFIEQPFRKAKNVKNSLLLLLVVTLFLVSVLTVVIKNKGFPDRFSHLTAITNLRTEGSLQKYEAASALRLVVVGDSLASSVGRRLRDDSIKNNISFESMSAPGCVFAPDADVFGGYMLNEACMGYTAKWVEKLSQIPPSYIVMFARYPLMFDEGKGFADHNQNVSAQGYFMKPHDGLTVSKVIQNSFDFLIGLGHRIIFIEPFPEFSIQPSQVIKNILENGSLPNTMVSEIDDASKSMIDFDTYLSRTNLIRLVTSNYDDNFDSVNLFTQFCSPKDKTCSAIYHGKIITYDKTHPSAPVDAYISQQVLSIIQNSAPITESAK